MGDIIYLIPNIKIKDYNKFRFNSDTDLPLNTIIEFRSILINVSCMLLSCHVHVSERIHALQLPECQGTPCSKQARNLKFK